MSPSQSPEALRAGAILTIDLDALVSNWRLFQDMAEQSGAISGAVVKAAAYGLDVSRIAPALLNAGCQTFFVATISEAIQLRAIIGPAPSIHVFCGFLDGTGPDFVTHNLVPVLNSLDQVTAWRDFDKTMPCDLHIDTGMARLGLEISDVQQLVGDLNIDIVLSHLVSAEDSDAPINARQLTAFKSVLAQIKARRISLANSSGSFLGTDYHFDVLRPGVALYGANPTPNKPNPMTQVIRLQGRILQVRTLTNAQSVGYGSTYQASVGAKIATIAVGYADGFLRSLSNAGFVYFGEHKANIVGCVSMDLITVDVTNIPQALILPGQMADLIGPNNPIDDVADKAGTIGYELLTQLGTRYHRVYTGQTGKT
ncbi:MAG: alanine racemase [Rhodospirillaceae bacterium]|nr:MAG: alanine racemase [Rhodospirillaceae bacterium]